MQSVMELNRRDGETVARLALEGLAECGSCKRVVKLNEVLSTWWRNTLVFAVCWPCISTGREMVVRRNPKGITVAMRGSPIETLDPDAATPSEPLVRPVTTKRQMEP